MADRGRIRKKKSLVRQKSEFFWSSAAYLGTEMADFSPYLFSCIRSEKPNKYELSPTSHQKMRLGERNRTVLVWSGMVWIFSVKFNIWWIEWRFYVVTAELGTKIRLSGIIKTIDEFEGNRPLGTCHCSHALKANRPWTNLGTIRKRNLCSIPEKMTQYHAMSNDQVINRAK